MISLPCTDPSDLPRATIPGFAQDLLASLLSNKGRTTEAIAQRRAALEKLEEILGPDHPELQPSLDLLAIDLLNLEDFASATPILQRTYRYRVAQFGLEHPDTIGRLAVLTECLFAAQLPAEAQPLLEKQLSLSERLKGPEHEDTLTAAHLLAKVYVQQGDRDSAEALLRQAQASFERTLGPTHPKSLACLFALFDNLSEGPNFAAAKPWGDKLLSSSQLAFGPLHPLTISAAEIVAELYAKLHDFAGAATILRQALAAFPRNPSGLTLEQAELQWKLVVYLDSAGQSDEAEALARPAARAFRAHLGRDHANTARAYFNLARLSIRRSLRTPWGRFRWGCWRLLARCIQMTLGKWGRNGT